MKTTVFKDGKFIEIEVSHGAEFAEKHNQKSGRKMATATVQSEEKRVSNPSKHKVLATYASKSSDKVHEVRHDPKRAIVYCTCKGWQFNRETPKRCSHTDDYFENQHKPVRVHLYPVDNILRPRGGERKKESLSLDLYERLRDVFDDWTDSEYGDCPSREELLERIESNLNEEINSAWQAFLGYAGVGGVCHEATAS